MKEEFEDFADILTDALMSRLQEDGFQGITIGVKTVWGPNGNYEAAEVKFSECGATIRTNLEKAFKAYQDGTTADEIADALAEQCEGALKQLPVGNGFIADYGKIRSRLMIDLVPKNRDLTNVPHGEMADLPFVCKAMLENGMVLINNTLLNKYGITEPQLFHDAFENAQRKRPAVITGMSEVLSLPQGVLGDDEFLFVATTPDRVHGAGVIAYPGFLDKAAKQLGGDFFVLPSSIHEVILAKDDGNLEAGDLNALVREVNSTEVSPEDQLSDNAYHYDCRAHIFELAEQFTARKTNER